MAQSPTLMDQAFSVPSPKVVPNGHTTVSHDSHMIPTAEASNDRTVPDKLVSSPSNSFDDCFLNCESNGFYEPNEINTIAEDLDDRVRHLSTIVENSNSSSDTEGSDYIQLNEVTFQEVNSQPAINSGNDIPSANHDAALPVSTSLSVNAPATDSLPEMNTDFIPPALSLEEFDLSTKDSQPPTENTLTNETHDYDEVESFRDSITPTQQTLEIASPELVSTLDNLPTTTEIEAVMNHSVLEREAPSPRGFYDVLSSVLSSPPLLDNEQGELNDNDEAIIKGTLGPPMPVDWSNEVSQ